MTKKCVAKDVIIIGAGMAGLTAALYASRMNLNTLVLENALVGGQIANAAGIENYPGLPNVMGSDLITAVQKQAETYGAEVDEFDSIERVDLKSDPKIVETAGCIYETPVVIIASGMNRRKLPLAEAERYDGKGIHYCELCDGHMYQDKVIGVIGGGNAAADAADFLTKYAKKLYLIHRSELRADEISRQRLQDNPKVTIMLQTDLESLAGEGRLERVKVHHKNTNTDEDIAIDGIFVNIGVIPNTELFAGQLPISESGHLIADENTVTAIPGVFAAGDIRVKEVRQLTTAAADGTAAAIMAERYLKSKA